MNLDQILRLRNELVGILQAKRERLGAPRSLREKLFALREAYGAAWVGTNVSNYSYPGPETGKLGPIRADIVQPEPAIGTSTYRKAPTTSNKVVGSKAEPKTSGRKSKWQRKP